MSITRQQRRAMKRKLGGKITNEQADNMILALRESAEKRKLAIETETNRRTRHIRDEVTAKVQRELEPQIRAQAVADTLILVLAFEHVDRGHTGKYLAKWLHDFNLFGDAVNESGEGMQAIIDILRDECGLDIQKEFALCEVESNRRAAEKMGLTG